MLTQSEKETILCEFPNIKLSYENIVYKKVYNSDYIVAIPEGKKCFAWFTSLNNKMICLLMELTNNKQIMDIKIENVCFSDELAYGTILYGTFFYHLNNNFFCIEDMFSYKGSFLDRMNMGDKLGKINHMLKNDLKQVSYNNNFLVFGLPLMCKTNEELECQIQNITYNIDTVQYKLFNRTNNYLYMQYTLYKTQISQTTQVLLSQYQNNNNKRIPLENKKIEKPIYTQTKIPEKSYERTTNVKRDIVFMIRPDIQNDIYYVNCLNSDLKEEQHGIAHIADYNTSVMMNKLFRIIKENGNLDALEESDDEEEFENEKLDKFVCLDKSYKMVCQFNHKFKKWAPIKLTNEKANVITVGELKYIYNGYEQNKKKNQYRK